MPDVSIFDIVASIKREASPPQEDAMEDDSKCQTEPHQSAHEPHPNAVGMLIGWQAARSGQPKDPSMGEAWNEGWRLFHWMHKTPSGTRH